MFTSTCMPKNDKNFSFEKSIKQSINQTILRGYFAQVRRLLENNQADPNELYEANLPQPLSVFLAPVISNVNNPNFPPSVSNLSLVISSVYSCHGRTPLMFCASMADEKWSYGIAQNLLEKGAKLGLKDPNGLNALMYACIHSKKSLVNLYLNALGDFQLLTMDNFGNTALHIASLGHNESICKILCDVLVKYDINPLIDIQKNKLGHNPFDLCFVNGHKSCMENYNRINEHFIAKQAKQNSSRIQTAYKKEGPISRTTLFSINESPSNASRLSSNPSSIQQYQNNILNSVNCPSVLFEQSEMSYNITNTVAINNTVQEIENQFENQSNELLTQQQSQFHMSPTNLLTTASLTNKPISIKNLVLTYSPSPNLVNSLEIYKVIYPYKENLIKESRLIKKPKKEESVENFKPLVFELRPLTGTILRSKTNFNSLTPRDEILQDVTKRELKSAIINRSMPMKREKNDLYTTNSLQLIDSKNSFKHLTFRDIRTQSPNKIEHSNVNMKSLEQLKTDNWRKRLNNIINSFEYQTTESYRKSHHYIPSSKEDLTAVHAHHYLNSMHHHSIHGLNNNRLTSSQPRKVVLNPSPTAVKTSTS